MAFRHSSGIRHSCVRLLSRGVFPGREQVVGPSQGQTGSFKVSDFPTPFSVQIARKNLSNAYYYY